MSSYTISLCTCVVKWVKINQVLHNGIHGKYGIHNLATSQIIVVAWDSVIVGADIYLTLKT